MAKYGVSKPAASTSGADWEELDESTVLKRGIYMDIIGRDGAGKSSLAMTLSEFGPLAYIDIDRSSDRAKKPDTKKQREGVKILPVSYAVELDEDKTKKLCEGVWSNLETKIKSADWAKGVVIDTGDELWELKRFASFGRQSGSGNRMDRLYGPVNAQFRNLLRGTYRFGTQHLITTHKMKEEYKDRKDSNGAIQSVKTGAWTRSGFKEIPYMADIIVEAFVNDDNEFSARIINCKLGPNGPSMRNMELTGDELKFSHIVATATDTEPGDWINRGKK